MKNKITYRLAAGLMALSVLAGCIHETYPMGSTQREDQVMGSDLALEGLVNGISSSMMQYNTAGYYSSYGVHLDFGIPAIHIVHARRPGHQRRHVFISVLHVPVQPGTGR